MNIKSYYKREIKKVASKLNKEECDIRFVVVLCIYEWYQASESIYAGSFNNSFDSGGIKWKI